MENNKINPKPSLTQLSSLYSQLLKDNEILNKIFAFENFNETDAIVSVAQYKHIQHLFFSKQWIKLINLLSDLKFKHKEIAEEIRNFPERFAVCPSCNGAGCLGCNQLGVIKNED